MRVLRRSPTAPTTVPNRPVGQPSASPALVWLALSSIYVIWGSTYLFIRVAIRTIPPFLMASIRFVIAGAVLYVWASRRRDGERSRPTWHQWRAATIVGGLLLLGGNGGVVWAEQKVAIGVVAIVIAMVPVWMAMFDRLFYGQRLSRWVVVGLLLGFGGLVLLVGGPGHARVDTLGLLAAIAASLSWATGSLYARKASLPSRPLVGTAMEMLAGGVLLGVAGAITGEVADFHPSAFSSESLWSVAYLIMIGSWIGFASYVWLLRAAPTSLVSTYAYVNPVIAVFLGWAFLDETLHARTLVAAAIIVAGVALIISARSRAPKPALEADG